MVSSSDWARIQALGVKDTIKNSKEYKVEVAKGTLLAQSYLSQFDLKKSTPNIETIQLTHYLMFRNVHPWAGEFRQAGHEVDVGNIQATESTLISTALNQLKQGVDSVLPQAHSSEKEIFWYCFHHNSFESIHPFADGNGRVGRLILGQLVNQSLNDGCVTLLDKKQYLKALRCDRHLLEQTEPKPQLTKLILKNRFTPEQAIAQREKLQDQGVEI